MHIANSSVLLEELSTDIAAYVKEEDGQQPSAATVQRFASLALNNLEFFIAKLVLRDIFQNRLQLPAETQMKLFQKLEKLRYIICQVGKTMQLKSNIQLSQYLLMVLRSANLAPYFHDTSRNTMLKVVERAIDLIYGFIVEDEFL